MNCKNKNYELLTADCGVYTSLKGCGVDACLSFLSCVSVDVGSKGIKIIVDG